MNVEELKRILDRADDGHQVCIRVAHLGTVGPSPTVGIKSIQAGFDWDNGKLIVYPETELRATDRDEISGIQKQLDILGNKYLSAARAKKVEAFKTVVIEELISIGIYNRAHQHDAKKAFGDAIKWNVDVALDPLVSEDAIALMKRAREMSEEEFQNLCNPPTPESF